MGSESKSPSWSSCGPVVLVAEEAGRDQASKGQRRNFQGSEPTAHTEAAGRRFLPLAAWCPGRPSRNEVTRGSGECALPDRRSPRVRLYRVCRSRPREAWGPQAFGPEWRCGLPPASRVYLHKPRASSLGEPPRSSQLCCQLTCELGKWPSSPVREGDPTLDSCRVGLGRTPVTW